MDQYDGYNGSPDRYDWQLIGKRELLVPYNNYRIGDKRLPYSQIVARGLPTRTCCASSFIASGSSRPS